MVQRNLLEDGSGPDNYLHRWFSFIVLVAGMSRVSIGNTNTKRFNRYIAGYVEKIRAIIDFTYVGSVTRQFF